jgi:hypothetical protein
MPDVDSVKPFGFGEVRYFGRRITVENLTVGLLAELRSGVDCVVQNCQSPFERIVDTAEEESTFGLRK